MLVVLLCVKETRLTVKDGECCEHRDTHEIFYMTLALSYVLVALGLHVPASPRGERRVAAPRAVAVLTPSPATLQPLHAWTAVPPRLGARPLPAPAPPPPPPLPGLARAHQRDALTAVWGHFSACSPPPPPGSHGSRPESTRRATAVLPPGTGKTLVGLWAAEAECRVGAVSVVVMPTLPLIDQTLAMYRTFSPAIAAGDIKVLVVGSDCPCPVS